MNCTLLSNKTLKGLVWISFITGFCAPADAQIPFRHKEGWQIVDPQTKKPLLNEVYEEMHMLSDDVLSVKKNNKVGLMKTDGTYIVFPEYAQIKPLGDYYAFTSSGEVDYIQGEVVGGLWGIMDATGKIIVKPAYHQIEYGNETMFLVQVNGNWGDWGVIDAQGKWLEKAVHPSKSSDMRPFPTISIIGPSQILIEGKAFGDWTIKDLKTLKSKTIRHEDFWRPSFEGGSAVVYTGKGSALIKYDGSVLIPAGEASIRNSETDFVFVVDSKQIVLQSKAGKKLGIYKGYDDAAWKGDYGLLTGKGKYTIVNRSGNEVLQSETSLQLLSDDYALQYTGENGQLVIDLKTGQKSTVPDNYRVEAYDPETNLAVLESGSKKSIYDFSQMKFTTAAYHDIYFWKNNLYVVAFTYRQIAVVDGKTGEKFYRLRPDFKVSKWGNKYSISDEFASEYIFKDEFDDVSEIYKNDSLFIVRKGQDKYILNAVQRTMSAPYSSITYAAGNFIVSNGGKSGLVGLDMKEFMPCTLTEITLLKAGDNYYFRYRSGMYGLSDAKGKVILDTAYNLIEDRGGLIVFKTRMHDYGFLNKEGKNIEAVNGMYYYSFARNTDWVSCNFSGKRALLHVPDEKVIWMPENLEFEDMLEIEGLPAYFYVRRKQNTGIMDQAGKVVLPAAEYEKHCAPESPVQFLNAKTHALILSNNNGKLDFRKVDDLKQVQEEVLSEISFPALYALKKDNAYLLVDKTLKPLCDQKFMDMEDGVFTIVARNMQGKYGSVDGSCQTVVPFIYDGYEDEVWQYSEFRKGDEYHLFSADNLRVFENLKITKSEMLAADDMYLVLQTGKTKAIVFEAKDEVVLENLLAVNFTEEVFYYNELSAVEVKTAAGFGLFSLVERKYLIEPVYEKLENFYYAPMEAVFIKVKKNGKYNLYDMRSHTFLFPVEMDEIPDSRHEDVIKAFNGKELYIFAGQYDYPKQVSFKLEPQYKKARFAYEYDLAVNDQIMIVVTDGKKKGLLRQDGSWLIKPELDSYEYWHNEKYMLVTKDGLKYILKSDGTYLVSQGFQAIDFSTDGDDLAIGYNGDQEFVISENGTVTPR